jgi:hypothetical protein
VSTRSASRPESTARKVRKLRLISVARRRAPPPARPRHDERRNNGGADDTAARRDDGADPSAIRHAGSQPNSAPAAMSREREHEHGPVDPHVPDTRKRVGVEGEHESQRRECEADAERSSQ